MRNPFKRSGDGSHNPSGELYRYSRPSSSNRLIIIAGVITFVVIIVVMFESVVVVQAGHRGATESHSESESNSNSKPNAI